MEGKCGVQISGSFSRSESSNWEGLKVWDLLAQAGQKVQIVLTNCFVFQKMQIFW